MSVRIKNIVLNFVALLIGFLLLLCMIAIGEVFLHFRKDALEKDQQAFETNLYEFNVKDPVLGIRNKPGMSGIHSINIAGETIFSSLYQIDESGRRITPLDNLENREAGALFFGCSFTFGFGVDQQDTLPAGLGRACPKLLPINFAVDGYGPQHMWLQIQEEDFLKEVPEEQGVVLYGFIQNHLDRLMGERNLITSWGANLPWLYIDEKEVRFEGHMLDREAQRSFAIKALKSLYTGRYVLAAMERVHTGRFVLNRLNMLPCTEEKAVATLAFLFADIKKKLADILPGYELIVFSYPFTDEVPSLAGALADLEIPFLNYCSRYDQTNIDYGQYLYADLPERNWGHPKANVYADVARWLSEDLQRFCNREKIGAETAG